MKAIFCWKYCGNNFLTEKRAIILDGAQARLQLFGKVVLIPNIMQSSYKIATYVL